MFSNRSSLGRLCRSIVPIPENREKRRASFSRCKTCPRVEELEPRLVLTLPYPDHILIAIEENHGYSQIIDSPDAPYINSLAGVGALFTNSFALHHPSQPNYLDLYSGSNQGQTSDSCPHTFSTDNLGGELEQSGYSFAGYSEDMPSVGYTGCTFGAYARKHNPWVNFTDVPKSDNLPYQGYFPADDYTQLPTVSFVIPNQNNDMHNGSDPATIQQGDAWLAKNLDPYVQWTFDNNSLFIVTFDEDNNREGNHIATLFVGPMVVPGQYDEPINHYSILRTIEDIYGLPYAGQSEGVDPIQDVWVDGGGSPGIPRGGKDNPIKNLLSPSLFQRQSREVQSLFTQTPLPGYQGPFKSVPSNSDEIAERNAHLTDEGTRWAISLPQLEGSLPLSFRTWKAMLSFPQTWISIGRTSVSKFRIKSNTHQSLELEIGARLWIFPSWLKIAGLIE